MDRRTFLALSAGASLPWAVACTSPADPASELFNGRDLSGWEGDESLWLVEDGAIVGRSPGIGENVFLATTGSYENFVLRMQVLLVNDQGNSGVQFRSEREPNSTEMIGYQADIGPGWWGNLYDESRRRKNLAEADPVLIERTLRKGDWNDYEIRAEGARFRLLINGVETVDYIEDDPAIERSGRIALQIHSGPPLEVRFRNLRLEGL